MITCNRINIKEGKLLINGQFDTSLVGGGFIIESTTNCAVDIQGFEDEKK